MSAPTETEPDLSPGCPPGTVLGDWPINLAGMELDRVDEDRVEWSVTSFTGWGSAAPTGDTTARVGAHGATAPRWYRQAKEMTVVGAVDAPTPRARKNAENRLLGAVTENDMVLQVLDEVPSQMSVRLNGELEITDRYTYTFGFEIPMLALDPLRYSLHVHTGVTELPSTEGGWSFPRLFPLHRDATTVSGTISAPNAGTVTAWPIYTIYGPVSDIAIRNAVTGEAMHLNAELGEGEWIVLDTGTHQVLMFGEPTANRRSWFWGTWWGLTPGANTVQFGAASGGTPAVQTLMATEASTLHISYRDTWY